MALYCWTFIICQASVHKEETRGPQVKKVCRCLEGYLAGENEVDIEVCDRFSLTMIDVQVVVVKN